MYSNYKRLYINQSLISKEHITLTDNQRHYIKNVMRIKKNDFLKLFNGKDGEWLAKIVKIEKKVAEVYLEKKINKQKDSPDLWLLFAPIKKDRLNILVQKATELGVINFVPIKTERTNINKINLKNLKQNAIEAAQQSQRLDIPEVQKEIKIEKIINKWPKDRCILFCDEKSSNIFNIIEVLNKIKNDYKKWSVIIGPEGGFSLSERNKLLKLKNLFNVTLGKRILRSDTATVAALYCIQQIIDI